MIYSDVPAHYYSDAKNQGTIVRISYTAESTLGTGALLEKSALVYLPFGYDTDTNRRYDVFYNMHGGGGSENEIIGGIGGTEAIKNIIDNMIELGDVKPFIIVTPTFYTSEKAEAAQETGTYYLELKNVLISKIDADYRTLPSREHRAFGGFSMGSEATWNVFANCLDEIRYYLPMSGDCWAVALKGGLDRSVETAKYLADKVRASDYRNDYLVYAITGDKDIAYEPMSAMIAEMKKFNDEFPCENLIYTVVPGGYHSYVYCNKYIYNAIPLFFGK